MGKHPQINLLLDLQEIDSEVGQLQQQLNRYPGIWEEAKAELGKKNAKVAELQELQERRQAEKRKTEQELRISSEKLKHNQSLQMRVSSGKELTAVSGQIDALKKNIARLEERGLQILEEDPKIEARIAEAQKELSEAKDCARVERERIREQVTTKKSRIDYLRAERDKLAPRVESEAMELYDRVRQRWSDNPVVAVRHGSCTGCNYALLPNRLVSLHKADELMQCDHCGRVLSEDESYQPEEVQSV